MYPVLEDAPFPALAFLLLESSPKVTGTIDIIIQKTKKQKTKPKKKKKANPHCHAVRRTSSALLYPHETLIYSKQNSNCIFPAKYYYLCCVGPMMILEQKLYNMV